MSSIEQLPRDCLLDVVFFLPGDEICKLERVNRLFYRLLHMSKRERGKQGARRRRTPSIHEMNPAFNMNADLNVLRGRDLWIYICDVHFPEQMKHRRKFPSAIQPQLFYMYQLKTDWYNEMHNLERLCASLEELMENSKMISDCCVFHPDLMSIYAKLFRMDKYFIGQNISDHHFARVKMHWAQNFYPFMKKFACDKGERKRLILLVRFHESELKDVEQLQRKQQNIDYIVPYDQMHKDNEHADFLEQKKMERKEFEALEQENTKYDHRNLVHFEDFFPISYEDYSAQPAAGISETRQFIGFGQANARLTVKINKLYQCWVERWINVLNLNPRYKDSATTMQYDLQHVNVVPITTDFTTKNYLRMANGAVIRRAVYANYVEGHLTVTEPVNEDHL